MYNTESAYEYKHNLYFYFHMGIRRDIADPASCVFEAAIHFDLIISILCRFFGFYASLLMHPAIES
jgi:hypothetical protein